VVELGVSLDRLDRGRACFGVALRLELEVEASTQQLIALGPEIGTRLREREVDVEEDR
jgi:hypothetical protein